MNRLIPAGKMNKRQKRILDASRRGSWNGVNPVTRVLPNKKQYSRKRARREAFRYPESES